MFMSRALELAAGASRRDEVPVGAVLVAGGKILAEGSNRREEKKRAASHAEIEALEAYSQSANGWRVPPETSLICTVEPCLMCVGALLWARVDSIYYGCKDTKNAGLLRVQPFIEAGVYDHRFTEIRGGILEEDCAESISRYFREKRRAKIESKRSEPAHR